MQAVRVWVPCVPGGDTVSCQETIGGRRIAKGVEYVAVLAALNLWSSRVWWLRRPVGKAGSRWPIRLTLCLVLKLSRFLVVSS